METEPVVDISASDFCGTPRFAIRRRLGMGGFGIVYEAFDRELDEVVALKTLRRTSPAGVQQLKREFRQLADIRHPNLVSLHELHVHDDTWFFTMELVRGVSFLDWVWEIPDAARPTEVRVNRDRLTTALAQLVRALRALHAAGHLHRDVKPSNVLVAEDGRVVVLDFGLVTMIGARDGGAPGGSPGYSAPEALRGGALSPASDWYSVGAMLHEAIHGHLPRVPGAVVGGRDPLVLDLAELQDLAEVANGLLAPEPSQRRIDALNVESGGHAMPDVASPLIGRERELALLDAALSRAAAGAPTVAIVHGPSGIGKSRLVRAYLDSVEARAVALSATCRDREMIPYRALDGVVESLVQRLKRRDEEVPEISPVHAYALTRTFPAFRLIPAISRRASAVREVPDPPTLRQLAFLAFCAVVARTGRHVPVVIALDDLQWGDSDSAELLRELLAASVPAGLSFVLACRSDGELPGTLPPWWHFVLDDRWAIPIAVPPLSREETAALVLSTAAVRRAPAIVQRIVDESEGNPFFAIQLVHADDMASDDAPDLDHVLTRQLDALSRGARCLVEDIALVGRPIDCEVALAFAARHDGSRASLAELQRSRLALVRDGETSSVIEIAHDRLRTSIVAVVSAEEWAARHRGIAELLEGIPRYATESDLLFSLCYEAGAVAKASLYAERAAARAASAFAFHQAAELYRKAAECAETEERRRAMRQKLADALADAGSGAFAAPIYDELATTAPRDDAIALRQRAMEGYLTSGHVDLGLRTLRGLCDDLGLAFPLTPGRAFASSLWLMARARVRGPNIAGRSQPPSVDEAVRLDTCFSAAKGLIGSDAMRGAYFAFRALDLATRARDGERTTRYLAFVGAAILAAAGGGLGRWGRRMLAAAELEIERRGEPELLGTLLVCKGQVAILDGQWPDALSLSDRALEILVERCRNVGWEKNFAQMGALRALEELGQQKESMIRVERFLRQAAQTGDVYARVTAGIWRGLHRIGLGQTDAARADADAAVRAWSPEGYHVQHLYSMRVHLHADLYEGKPDVAMARFERDRPAIESSFLTRVPTGRIDVALMRGRAALALARIDPSRRKSLLVSVERIARSLRKETRPDAAAHASLLEAGLYMVRGDTERAIACCAAARSRFAKLSMQLFAACAKHREGELAGGELGRQLRAEALAVMAEQAIQEPSSWLRLCSPGFPDG